MSPQEQLEILKRGTAEIISEKALLLKLENSAKEKKPLRVKLGIDPTAPDIHLGHSVVLRKLRQFQDLGHRVILIIGDFTAKIGDPTGRSEIRKVLTDEEIKANTQTYLNQIGAILDTRNSDRFELRYNSEWLSRLTFADVIALSHHFTVAQMLEREDFSKRYEAGKAIGLHEFFYPVMQGYDSVAIRADVEMGGTDQKFNILVGREMQRIDGSQSPQIVFLMPILEGTDGVQKMSKSLGNYIGITEPPDEMFGKVMSIPDQLMPRYYELLTDAPITEVEKLKNALHPMHIKRIEEDGNIIAPASKGLVDFREWKARLAELIVASYHGAEAGKKSRENFDRVFKKKQAPDEIADYVIPAQLLHDGKVSVTILLVETGIVPSMREARRLLAQGGVRIDNETLRDEDASFQIHEGMVLKAGKRHFVRLRLR